MDPAEASYCVLRAGERRFRIAAADVLEIVPWPRLTAVPLAPDEGAVRLLGLFLMSDAAVPVFQVAELPAGERHHVVIVRANVDGRDIPLGIAAAEVGSAGEWDESEILDVPALAAHLAAHRR